MDLKQQIINELHHPARRNFPRRSTVIKGLNDLYQSDLVDMQAYKKVNKGFSYILLLIDCASKRAFGCPLKNKTGKHVTESMRKLIIQNNLNFKHLQTDDGKEYYNKWFKKLMDDEAINHYSTKSEKKAAIIERFNRTLKGMMFKRFSLKGDYVWFNDLQLYLNKYNDTLHKTIGMKPNEVNKNNIDIVLKRIKVNTKPKRDLIPPKKFELNDRVRLSKYKGIFGKSYLPNFTNEVFEVYKILPTTPETYLIRDLKNSKNNESNLLGSVYGHELLKSNTGDVYLVQKILKKKKDKVLVQWIGFNRSENAWIPTKDLI